MKTTPISVRVLEGAPAIANAIGLGMRPTYRLLLNRDLPVRKLGTKYMTSERALQEFFAPVLGPDRDLAELLWRGRAISEFTNLPLRRTFYLTEQYQNFPVLRVGGLLVSGRYVISEYFDLDLKRDLAA